jgi:hypothetical protein
MDINILLLLLRVSSDARLALVVIRQYDAALMIVDKHTKCIGGHSVRWITPGPLPDPGMRR